MAQPLHTDFMQDAAPCQAVASPQALLQQALAWHRQGQWAQAHTGYAQLLALQPAHFEALQLLGTLCAQTGQHASALEFLERAIAIEPSYAPAHSNRGNVLKDLQRFEEALASYDRAIALQPDYAQAYSNRGISLLELHRFEQALESYERAIALAPTLASAHANRGHVLRCLGQVEEALASFDRAIALQPDLGSAYLSKSFTLLLAGDYAQGWALHEWRWKAAQLQGKARTFSQALWTGQQAIENQTLLLHAEQGLGDIIQFCRYCAVLQQRGARVVLEVPALLLSVLQSLPGVDRLIAFGQALPPFDLHCPLMSLPLACDTRLDTVPSPGAYLQAPPDKVRYWRDRLGQSRRLKVGLVWNGGFRPDQPAQWSTNARRNIALQTLSQALRSVPVDFFSLQKGEPAESEIWQREPHYWPEGNFTNYAPDLQDFGDTAGLIANLDLVLAVDTSTAHLAAAMGKPTWILNRFDTCWRWLLDRQDSPWYDAVTLYRQDASRSWEPVLARVAADLHARAAAPAV